MAANIPGYWWDIESAPRDGTPVLAYGRGWPDLGIGDGPKPLMAVVFWREHRGEKFEENPDGSYRRVDDAVVFAAWVGSGPFTPTHWQPLPAPPQEAA